MEKNQWGDFHYWWSYVNQTVMIAEYIISILYDNCSALPQCIADSAITLGTKMQLGFAISNALVDYGLRPQVMFNQFPWKLNLTVTRNIAALSPFAIDIFVCFTDNKRCCAK